MPAADPRERPGTDPGAGPDNGPESRYPDRVMKFCPACGAYGFTVPGGFKPGAEGRNRFSCQECGFVFYINASIGTAAVIVSENRELLAVRRRRDPHIGTLDLPGGFAAPGECSEQALKREVREEVCLEVTEALPWKRTYCNTYIYRGIAYFTTDSIYLCCVSDWGTLAAGDPDEAEPVLIPIESFDPEEVGLPSIRAALYDILEDVYGLPAGNCRKGARSPIASS